MKRLFLFSLFIQACPFTCTYTPQNTVIGVDLHDTYLQKCYWQFTKELFSLFIQSNKKWELFCTLSQSFKIYNRAKQLGKECCVNQYVIENLCKEFPAFHGLEDTLIRANALHFYEPIMGTVNILRTLKNAGYTIFVVSNIGPKAYALTIEKYPAEFSLFDDYFIPDKAPSKKAKPDVEFYADLRDWLNKKGHSNKKLLFIDDSKEFINGAMKANKQGANIESLLFTTPQQLRKDLNYHEILHKKAFAT